MFKIRLSIRISVSSPCKSKLEVGQLPKFTQSLKCTSTVHMKNLIRRACLPSSVYRAGCTQFHSAAILKERTWQDGENQHYRDSLTKSGKYNLSLVKHKRVQYEPYDIDDITKALRSKSDDDLEACIRKLGELEDETNDKHVNARKMVNEECEKRMPSWNVDTQLKMCDRWYVSRLGAFASKRLYRSFLSTVSPKLGELTSQQLVHTLFIVNICRSLPSSWNFHSLESSLTRFLPSLSSDEASIVAAGYFKSSSKITTKKFYEAFVLKVREDSLGISDVSLCSALKLIRYSSSQYLQSWKLVHSLMDACVSSVSQRNLMACGQLALLGVPLKLAHEQLLNSVADRLCDCLTSARVKDMTYIVQALALLNMPNTHPCIDKVIEEFQSPSRSKEVAFYGHNMVPFLYFLALLNKFPSDLISYGLQPEFIEKSFHPNYSTAAVMELSLEIECPKYTGNHVKKPYLTQFIKKIQSVKSGADDGFVRSLQKDVMASLRSCLGRSDCTQVVQILPHFSQPDIVVRLSKNGKGVSLKDGEVWKEVNILQGNIRWAPAVDTWVAVVVGGSSQYIRPFFSTPAGYHAFKMRQLQKVGYKVIAIRSFDFRPLTATGKVEYLKKKLNECVGIR